MPKNLADLHEHQVLGFDTSISGAPFPEVNWLFERAEVKGLAPGFRVNSLLAMRTAVKQGMGIAALPDYLVHRTRHISRVLPEVAGPVTDAYYMYPMELKHSKRIAVFKAFIQQKTAEANF